MSKKEFRHLRCKWVMVRQKCHPRIIEMFSWSKDMNNIKHWGVKELQEADKICEQCNNFEEKE